MKNLSRIEKLVVAISAQEMLQDVAYYSEDGKHMINRDAFKALFGKGELDHKVWSFAYKDNSQGFYTLYYKVTVDGVDIYSAEFSGYMATPEEELAKLEMEE